MGWRQDVAQRWERQAAAAPYPKLFGSVEKGTARQDSDIDPLVEFEARRKSGLLRLAGIEAEISSLLGGRRVNLRAVQKLSPRFPGEIVRSAEIHCGT